MYSSNSFKLPLGCAIIYIQRFFLFFNSIFCAKKKMAILFIQVFFSSLVYAEIDLDTHFTYMKLLTCSCEVNQSEKYMF